MELMLSVKRLLFSITKFQYWSDNSYESNLFNSTCNNRQSNLKEIEILVADVTFWISHNFIKTEKRLINSDSIQPLVLRYFCYTGALRFLMPNKVQYCVDITKNWSAHKKRRCCY